MRSLRAFPDSGWLLAVIALPSIAILALGSLMLGRYPLAPRVVLDALTSGLLGGHGQSVDAASTIVLMVRLPRVAAALLVGGGLSTAGLAYQNLFRNPMASPSLLGVSAGAGFGASLAIMAGQSPLVVETAAFGFGLVSVGVAILVDRAVGVRSIVTLVLCGMVMSALFQAFISLLKYVADPTEALASITFWLMGGLGKASGLDVAFLAAPVLVGGAILLLCSWRISVLALGEMEAAALGVDVAATRTIIIVCATAMSAAAVSVAGIVGWVGLLVPHMARMAFGLEPFRLTIATAALGGVFLLCMDDVARTIAPVEVPLGVLTAIVGAPFFLLLLLNSRRRGWA
jgi:iron complex transport system permease protein